MLYNGMSRTSAWAALYFIALMTFGNYVLFNLLVAILVEGFSSEVFIRQLSVPWFTHLADICYIECILLGRFDW